MISEINKIRVGHLSPSIVFQKQYFVSSDF